jgi:ribonuclease D
MAPEADNPAPHVPPQHLRHRARSHESAHAHSLASGEGSPLVHPLVSAAAPALITTPADLARLLDALRAAGSFGFDTEFIGEQSYIPRLCLIQVALPDRVALVDPLAKLDVTPFWEIVCEPAIEKVVHAGQQDLEPVFRHLSKPAANVFDTQLAAGFVGLPYPLSLSKLMNELLGARLGKGLTFTSWDQRPLSQQQSRYAADDVRYLPAARRELEKRLADAGHAAWAAEECAELCRSSTCRFNPDGNYLRIHGASGLSPRNLAVLRELAIWRDQTARDADVPPRTLLKDEVIIALARAPVRSVEKLSHIRGLPRPVQSAHGQRIVELTSAALSKPVSSGAEMPAEMPPRDKFHADALWASAQAHCFAQQVDPALVASRQDIVDFRRIALTGGSLHEHRLMRGWRKAALGDMLAKTLAA